MLLWAGNACTATAQSAGSAAPLEVAVYPAAAPLKLWLMLVKPTTTKTTKIELVDAQNRALCVIGLPRKEQRISQLFDLSEMTDGMYKIRVTTGTEVVEKSFRLQTPVLLEQTTKRSLIFTPDSKVAAEGI